MGLDWTAIAPRIDGADADTRARVLDLLEEIEAGALKADAQNRVERGDN